MDREEHVIEGCCQERPLGDAPAVSLNGVRFYR